MSLLFKVSVRNNQLENSIVFLQSAGSEDSGTRLSLLLRMVWLCVPDGAKLILDK